MSGRKMENWNNWKKERLVSGPDRSWIDYDKLLGKFESSRCPSRFLADDAAADSRRGKFEPPNQRLDCSARGARPTWLVGRTVISCSLLLVLFVCVRAWFVCLFVWVCCLDGSIDPLTDNPLLCAPPTPTASFIRATNPTTPNRPAQAPSPRAMQQQQPDSKRGASLPRGGRRLLAAAGLASTAALLLLCTLNNVPNDGTRRLRDERQLGVRVARD